MSTIYDTEPQPTASVIVHTTGGEIAVELFAKQTPLTSRNFLQHCLDGYYDDTIFHRLVPGFVVQGGDPTGTGNGGESIYDGGALSGDLDPWPMDERHGANAGPTGINFKDEFHSRLRFNRRGLLGMANEGSPNTNSSQFFFTLDKTDELNGKNTMFGRVMGPTIYNLMKIGQGEVQEGTERPLYPTKITRIEIVTNPFSDMRITKRDARRSAAAIAQQQTTIRSDDKKNGKRKKGVNKNLLSFGDDVEDDLEMDMGAKRKMVKLDKVGGKTATSSNERPKERQEPERTGHHKTTLPSRTHPEQPVSVPAQPPLRDDDESLSDSNSERDARPRPQRKPQLSALEKTNAEIAALKASMRRTVAPEPTHADEVRDGRSALEKMVPSEAKRGKKFGRKNGLSSHDHKTLRFLDTFTSKLGQTSNEHAAASATLEAADGGNDGEQRDGNGEVCELHFIANCQSCRPWDKAEDEENSDGEDWMSHTLNCAADKLGKDLSYRKKAEEELVVIDPRERAQTLREDKRSVRDARGRDGGRGGGGRPWDQARHARMSQAAALSGRGAR